MEALQQWIDQVPSWALVVGAGVVIIVVQRVVASRGGGGDPHSDTVADSSHASHDHHGAGDSGGDN